MKRTTIVLEDNLFYGIKQAALKSQLSLRDYISAALRQIIVQKKQRPVFKLKWKTVKGKTLPAAPLDDRDRLIDFLNESA